MAIVVEAILTLIVVCVVGFVVYIKGLPLLKEFSKELIPYEKATSLIVTLVGALIILLVIEAAVGAFLSTGILSYDAVKWLGFVEPSISLVRSVIERGFSAFYYIALIYIGYNISKTIPKVE